MSVYTEAHLIGDADRLKAWSAELRFAVGIGDASNVAYLAKAIGTVANRIAAQDGRAYGEGVGGGDGDMEAIEREQEYQREQEQEGRP